MKTAEEIEKLVKSKGEKPKDIFEQMYFVPLKNCVKAYKYSLISREELHKEQQNLKNLYEQLIMWNRIIEKHQKINIALSQVQLCGCDKCKEIEKIMTNRNEGRI